MSLKKSLGLESFRISGEEIMKRLANARKNNLDEILFRSDEKVVKIKLHQVEMAGVDPTENWFW